MLVLSLATVRLLQCDRAKAGRFAYPAINVTSSQSLNAALRGFAEAESDGIVQVSTGGAEYLAGSLKDMVVGASALAEYAHVVAATMYLVYRWHKSNGVKYREELNHLLAIARSDKH